MHALEAGDDRDLAVLLEALDQLDTIHVQDARGGMRVIGQNRQLPALPGPRVDAHAFEDKGEQAGGHLLAGCHHRVVLARVMQHRGLLAPFHQLIGHAGHGGDHDGHVVAGVDLALDVARHIADAVEIGDRRSAEFHHQPSHDVPVRAERR